MANLQASKKHAIKSKKLNKFNSSRRSMLRTLIKKVKIAVLKKKKDLAQDFWYKLQPVLDRFAHKKLIHKNKASRYKSRLLLSIKNIK